MILTRHTTICDGCGCLGPTSDHDRDAAWRRASAEGWTVSPGNYVAKHWCPVCTRARRTQPTTKEPER